MSGKSKMGSSRPDGKPTRTKIDLFPEYIRHLPPKKRAVWDVAGRVLRSKELGNGFRTTTGARVETPIRRKICNGQHVSGANPDSRHSWIPHLQTYSTALERNHRPVLSAGRQLNATYRHDLSRGACRMDANRKKRRCHSRPIPVTRSPWPITPGIRPIRWGRR